MDGPNGMSVTPEGYGGPMDDDLRPEPGDRVTYLDLDGHECVGTVTAYVPDASGCGAGFAGFVCWDPIREGHNWGYLAQIIALNDEVVAA